MTAPALVAPRRGREAARALHPEGDEGRHHDAAPEVDAVRQRRAAVHEECSAPTLDDDGVALPHVEQCGPFGEVRWSRFGSSAALPELRGRVRPRASNLASDHAGTQRRVGA